MTCLYCGKKLGFFSRYKDTPFCSEEHLRSHQNELEHALIERLGSKAAPPPVPKSGAPVPIAERSNLNQTSGESRSRALKQESAPEELRGPAPLCEDRFPEIPPPIPALAVQKPLLSPSTFAIIVQADCCTPGTPDPSQVRSLPLQEEQFEMVADEPSQLATALPSAPAFSAEAFGEPWLLFPEADRREAKRSLSYSLDFDPLEYEAVPGNLKHTPLGRREEITPRVRFRYPYAASEVSSAFNHLARPESIFTIGTPDTWDAILPGDQPAATLTTFTPYQADLGSIAHLHLSMEVQLHAHLPAPLPAETSNLAFEATELSDVAGLHLACSESWWENRPVLPAGNTAWLERSHWQRLSIPHRVPPVTFPSLFQLTPVLPPRPAANPR